MALIQIDAIYENGVLRPTEPLPFREHERVTITVRSEVSLARQRRLFPRLGKSIARASLSAEHGLTKLTAGQQPTHTTWWPSIEVDRADLFKLWME